MKKICVAGVAGVLAAAVALGQPVLAQAGGAAKTAQHPALGKLKKLADYLGLTADQKAQIKPIMKDAAQQVRAVRADGSLSAADKKEKIRMLRQASRKQILAILTPAQKAKLATLRQHRKAAGEAGAQDVKKKGSPV